MGQLDLAEDPPRLAEQPGEDLKITATIIKKKHNKITRLVHNLVNLLKYIVSLGVGDVKNI